MDSEDDWPFPTSEQVDKHWGKLFPGDKGEQSDPDAPGHLAGWLPEPNYGADDYCRLPEFGVGFYSLTDAALVGALDMWASDKVAGVPCESWQTQRDDPKIRAALGPLQAQILAALVRSVESKQIDAEVLGRRLSDSSLIPERAFIRLQHFVDWLEVHGHERGDLIADIEEDLQNDPWQVASGVAAERARLRLSHLKPEGSTAQDESKDWLESLDLEGLRRAYKARSIHIIHLEQQLRLGRGAVGADKHLTTRERRTLLTIIAALCKKAGIDIKSRKAAAAILSAADELGTPVSDDTARGVIRDIPDAIERRSR